MNTIERKPRIAVISPFLDKSHGTERIVLEWISRLDRDFDFHVYSQSVADLDLSRIVWHRIPKLPGPHVFNYLWWFLAIALYRDWHRRFRGLAFDMVFSPGVNCMDADVISVHIVFREFKHRVHSQLQLLQNPVSFWPRLLHRRLYYGLICFLEQRAYTNPKAILMVIAKKTLGDLDRLYHRRDGCVLVYLGLDHATFNPDRRVELRGSSRNALQIPRDRFQLLMVGNDWHKKGIRVLLESLRLLQDLPIDLMIVGSEDPTPFRAMVDAKDLGSRVRFLPPRADVEFYYAAADLYVGPSLEDTFALPPQEAMACGLPVIVSLENGVSEIIEDGVDGFILRDATDCHTLSLMIRKLYNEPELSVRIGEKAAEKVRQFTWENNAHVLAHTFEQVIMRKSRLRARTLTQGS